MMGRPGEVRTAESGSGRLCAQRFGGHGALMAKVQRESQDTDYNQ